MVQPVRITTVFKTYISLLRFRPPLCHNEERTCSVVSTSIYLSLISVLSKVLESCGSGNENQDGLCLKSPLSHERASG